MKLGIFDSGLGGLLITRAVRDHLPEIDIFYYGDTLHLPYGNRSDEAIYEYTSRSMDYMFEQGCALIVVACNTASAACLRQLQQEYLTKFWPDRNIIGVVVPMLEEAIDRGYEHLGLIGTNYTVRSKIFEEELQKINPDIVLEQIATPLLVSLIENDGMAWAQDVLKSYIEQISLDKIEGLILGCTHYSCLKPILSQILEKNVEILSQDDIIPAKLADYLEIHHEYNNKIAKNGQISFHVSDLTDNYVETAHKIYGEVIDIVQSGAQNERVAHDKSAA